jgi:hypothetical protein
MTGNHRAEETSKAPIAAAGALTAGALLIAPVGVTLVAPAGTAHADRPGDAGGGDKPKPIIRITILSKPKIDPPKQKIVRHQRLHRPASQTG